MKLKMERLDLYIKKSFGKDYELRFSAQNVLETKKDRNTTFFKADGSIGKTEYRLFKSNRIFYLSFMGRW